MSVSALPSGDEQAEADPSDAAKDRSLLEKLDQEIPTLQIYADVLEVPSERSPMASMSANDMACTASALVNVFFMLDEKESKAAYIESRMHDPIPPQPVVISTTALPLSLRPAIFGGLLRGIFAAFTASALLAVRHKSPT